MLKRLFIMFSVTALALGIFSSVLTGCSKSVSDSYPLESVTGNGKETSRVYRAANKTVPEVAKELTENKKPQEASKEDDERMFLVYSDEWYNIQKDPKNSKDTLIEVSNTEFVRNNYSPSFLEGYILASILNNVFDSFKQPRGSYRGYTDRDIYKPDIDYHKPTTQEKKNIPPLTKQGTGSIIKRSDKSSNVSGNGGTSDGSKKDVPEKDKATPPKDDTGKIIKSDKPSINSNDTDVQPKKSTISPPKNNSPPKTKVGGSGTITKRR